MGLNILYHHRTQGRGAEGVHIASIVRALEDAGHRVTVVSPPGVDPLNPASNAPVDKANVKTGGIQSLWKWISRHLPNALFELAEIAYNLPAWWRLRKVLKTERFDLVYERYAFYLLVGAWLAGRRGIPFVLEANEVSGIEHRARRQVFPRLCAWFERRLFKRCAGILTVSSHLRERILHQGVPPERVQVAPNAFDVKRIEGKTGRKPELARRLGLEGAFVFGFVGWFDHWDRLDMLIDVLAEVLPEQPQARVLLVGDGPVSAGLRDKVASLGLQQKVVFTGAVPRDQVFDHIALFDTAVFAHSNDFGSPVVMFEFMAMRVPIVAPRLAPILDVHEDGETALLFDRLDQAQCAAAVRRLIATPALREELAERAYRKLLAEHTWARNAEQILEAAALVPGSEAAGRPQALRPVA
ncbi:MAG: glycosyltransferase family 4 protein [Pseudomonadota bacterium]